MYHLDNKIFQF